MNKSALSERAICTKFITPALRKAGWDELLQIREEVSFTKVVATRGSHRQFKHALKPGRVTVAGKPSVDIAPGPLNGILKPAGLRSWEHSTCVMRS